MSAATIALGQSAIATGSEFEQVMARLKTTLGSQGAAEAAFKTIQQFSATTPFQVSEVTEAFIQPGNWFQSCKPGFKFRDATCLLLVRGGRWCMFQSRKPGFKERDSAHQDPGILGSIVSIMLIWVAIGLNPLPYKDFSHKHIHFTSEVAKPLAQQDFVREFVWSSIV